MDDVLHHCSYDHVNGIGVATERNPATSHDAAHRAPVGSATHRFRAPQPYRWFVSVPQNRPVAPLDPSACRAASGTGRHPTDEWLWNGRGQGCEIRSISVSPRVDSGPVYPQKIRAVT